MDKQKIKTAYDDYVDATVALFVECYSEACAERIHEEMTACSEENAAFPAALDKRCRELIKKEDAKRRRKQMWKTAKRISTSAAIVVLVMLALTSVLFATVEAVRIPIINYFIEQTEDYWKVASPENDNIDGGIIDLKNPLADIVPDGYQISVVDGDSWVMLTAIYENAEMQTIFFSARPYVGTIVLDSEDAEVNQNCTVLGHEAILVKKNDCVNITWVNKNLNTVFTLVASQLAETEVLRMAENFIMNMT